MPEGQGLASMYYTPQLGNVRKLGNGVGMYNTDATQFNNQVQTVDTTPVTELPKSTAIGDFGNTGGETSWWSDLKGAFTPQGDKGTSLGGNMVNAVGTGVNAAAGLAGMYFAKKNYDLQKDNQEYLRNREAQSDARKSTFAANAGNGATY